MHRRNSGQGSTLSSFFVLIPNFLFICIAWISEGGEAMKELRTPSGRLAGKYGFNEGRVILEIRFKKDHGFRIRIGLDGVTAEDI